MRGSRKMIDARHDIGATGEDLCSLARPVTGFFPARGGFKAAIIQLRKIYPCAFG